MVAGVELKADVENMVCLRAHHHPPPVYLCCWQTDLIDRAKDTDSRAIPTRLWGTHKMYVHTSLYLAKSGRISVYGMPAPGILLGSRLMGYFPLVRHPQCRWWLCGSSGGLWR